MFGCDGDEDIIVYRHSAILGWFSALYRRRTYTRDYLGDGGAWGCNESYMIIPRSTGGESV